MSTPKHLDGLTRELAHRVSNGVEVVLLWHPTTQRVSVTVLDVNTLQSFELVLEDGDRALDVFEHPFAYAAHRGVSFGAPAAPALAEAA
jgi:hypothetical protein